MLTKAITVQHRLVPPVFGTREMRRQMPGGLKQQAKV